MHAFMIVAARHFFAALNEPLPRRNWSVEDAEFNSISGDHP
jgi:hypothetical protein